MRRALNYKATATAVDARITRADNGGFLAVASTGEVDRDGEVLLPGALEPLPESVPVHLDHSLSASSVVARGRPYYVGGRLLLEATFGSSPDAQAAREKVADGLVDSVSIVFLGHRWEDRKGIRTLVQGELLACDLVSIPSNRGARILSARSMAAPQMSARDARAEVLLFLAEQELADAKAVLARAARFKQPRSASAEVRTFLRSLSSDSKE